MTGTEGRMTDSTRSLYSNKNSYSNSFYSNQNSPSKPSPIKNKIQLRRIIQQISIYCFYLLDFYQQRRGTPLATMAPPPSANVAEQQTSTNQYKILDQPIQSEYDNRQYKAIELANGLKVLLIHEAGLDKSCASLNVHIGHFCDPEDLQGAAHFLEHLLFMGTKKYPSEQDYSQYIISNGGYCNAFTQQEFTNYYFTVATEHFEGALDRLAQFFIAPLFDANSTEREMNAVDSEHSKNIQQDLWRFHRLSTMKASPQHPLHKFGTGSMNTLNVENVRDRIIDLYKTFYSSNLMTLVVYGGESLNNLVKLAVDKFSAIPLNPDAKLPQFGEKPFSDSDLGTIMYVKPIKDLRMLTFEWQLPSLLDAYTKKSDEYLIQLIGHEGQGSILESLKKRNLATSLSCCADKNGNFSIFNISIELTSKGEKEYWLVAEIVFAYLSLLRSQPVQQWIVEELAQLAFIRFTFKEKSAPENYALQLSSNLHIFPSKHVLNGDYVLESVDLEHIHKLMNELVADKVKLMLVTSDFVEGLPVEHEEHYKAPYQYQKIPSCNLKQLSAMTGSSFSELAFPTPNEFIATSFKLKGKTVDYTKRNYSPVELIKNVLWFKQDDTFGLPKVNINVLFQHLNMFRTDVKESILVEAFCESFINDTASKFYSATLAGLTFRIDPSVEGLEFKFSGLDDKMSQFIGSVLGEFFKFTPSKESFDISLESLQRKYKNYDMELPYLLSSYWLLNHLKRPSFSYVEKERESKSIKFSEMQQFNKKIATESFHIKLMINGNFTEQEAKELADNLFKVKSSLPSPIQITSLKANECFPLFKPVDNLNSATELFFQILPFENIRLRTLTKLYAQIFHEEFFHQVRTTEQFGYVSMVRFHETYSTIGVRFIVQSSTKNCEEIEERILKFIQDSLDILTTPSSQIKELFEKNVAGLKSNLLERYKSLTVESQKIWNQIINEQLNFEKNSKEAAELDSITQQDLIQFVKTFLLSPTVSNGGVGERRMFSIWIVGENSKSLKIVNRILIHQ